LGEVLPRMPRWYQQMAAQVGRSSPFSVFPWGWARFLETVLHPDHPYLQTFSRVPVFVPSRALAALNGLLFDPKLAATQRQRQFAYFDRLDQLPSLGQRLDEALHRMGITT
jgi:hypothetical protein